jgi:polyketide synthase PksJ
MEENGVEIAIIGISCRMPGAKNVNEYWDNIKNGIESITFFTEEELLEAGIDSQLLSNKNYIKANGMLNDVDKFDASFFDINNKEAEIMDPQHRLFLEEAYKALDDSGYSNSKHRGRVSIFAGCDLNTYLLHNIAVNSEQIRSLGDFMLMLTNDKDYLSTRVSYLLNLTGPSVNVQTACSTSLVAIHTACQSLLNGESDVALAGGVSIRPPMKQGYLYVKDMINSPDGHCRPFDANAEGTISGSGVGVVVLKTLSDAIRDKDNIIAVVKSSAINNDGANKVGFTAPSIKGQSDCIIEAIHIADIDANTIRFIETHGTGTKMGDPIEIQALDRAFKRFTNEKNFCALGAIKANIGHTSAAAGVAGFIKTALVVQNGIIPPLVNYQKPNPHIQFLETAFYVPEKIIDWPVKNKPRRASVSSFGIGGTNSHIILENAPNIIRKEQNTKHNLISLSAKSSKSLQKMALNLATYLQSSNSISLEDIAYTYHIGRQAYAYRKSIICSTKEELIDKLLTADPKKYIADQIAEESLPIFFLFPGQGSHYEGMFSELYLENNLFRTKFDRCADELIEYLNIDIRDIIMDRKGKSFTPELIHQTEYAQPIMFAAQYALANVLIDYEIKPEAMIGHSLGEYVAATIAGVFNLSDALKIVTKRGKLMQNCEAGAMVSVLLSEEQIHNIIHKNLSIAAINTTSNCVISGSYSDIDNFEIDLKESKITYQRLHTSHAFHSKMMEPCVEEFRKIISQFKLNAPTLKVISNIEGEILSAEDAQNPMYWALQIVKPVNFNNGIKQLLKYTNAIFVEIGPGTTLTNLTRENSLKKSTHALINLIPHQKERKEDSFQFLEGIAKLWSKGVPVNFEKLYQNKNCYRCSLPPYPFDSKSFWIHSKVASLPKNNNSKIYASDISEMFYTPVWKQSLTVAFKNKSTYLHDPVLVFSFGKTLAEDISLPLLNDSSLVFYIKRGEKFSTLGNNQYEINTEKIEDYHILFDELNLKGTKNVRIIFGCDYKSTEKSKNWHEPKLSNFFEIMVLAKFFGNIKETTFFLNVISNSLHLITGTEKIKPEQSLVRGAIKIIPLEYKNIQTRFIDLCPEAQFSSADLSNLLLNEYDIQEPQAIVAYRGKQRFIIDYQKLILNEKNEDNKLKHNGVYLITGGTSGIGLEIANAIATTITGAKIAILGRSKMPPRNSWEEIAKNLTHEHHFNVVRFINLEKCTSDLKIYSVDVSIHSDLKKVMKEIVKDLGIINGVIHAAGVADYNGVIENRTKEKLKDILLPKVHGTLALDNLVDYENLDFFILFSSLSTVFYKSKVGQVSYIAANEFNDTFSSYHKSIGKNKTRTLNWNDWKEVGMSVKANIRLAKMLGISADHSVFNDSLTVEEGKRVFLSSFFSEQAQLIISKKDLPYEYANYDDYNLTEFVKEIRVDSTARNRDETNVDDKVDYIEPSTDLQKSITTILENCLGVNKIGLQDNFFDLGGHSLLAIQAIDLIKKDPLVECELSLEVFFQNPTILELSEYIENVHWQSKINEAIEEDEQDEEEGIL